jgi:hypothetical protein
MISVDFYFYHVEKCAGMSFRHSVYEGFKDKYAEEQLFIPPWTVPGHYNVQLFIASGLGDRAYFENVKVIADHSNPGELAQVLNTEVEVRFRITALRHPVERALSHFHYFRERDSDALPELGEGRSLHELGKGKLEEFMTAYGNLQTIRLSNWGTLDQAIDAIRNMDSLIVCEEYGRSIELLNRVNPFGITFRPSTLNLTGEGEDLDYKSLYSEDFKRSLDKYCANDLTLYAEGRARFEELCAEQGVLGSRSASV